MSVTDQQDPTVVVNQNVESDLGQTLSHVPVLIDEAKAGYKTTEFWITVLVVVLTQLNALHLPGKYGDTVATVGAVVSYALSRGIAKSGVPHVAKSDDAPAA